MQIFLQIYKLVSVRKLCHCALNVSKNGIDEKNILKIPITTAEEKNCSAVLLSIHLWVKQNLQYDFCNTEELPTTLATYRF